MAKEKGRLRRCVFFLSGTQHERRTPGAEVTGGPDVRTGPLAMPISIKHGAP